MKRLLAGLALGVGMLALSGCYVDPGYSYVRQTPYQGDAYYGQGVRTYDPGYYSGYYPGYPVYGYGCCYGPGVSIGISSSWYRGPRYDNRGYRRGYDNGHRGSWRDHDHRRDDHRGHRRTDDRPRH